MYALCMLVYMYVHWSISIHILLMSLSQMMIPPEFVAWRRLASQVSIADPRRDDCPLIAVSDEFLTMTGYLREEVVGPLASPVLLEISGASDIFDLFWIKWLFLWLVTWSSSSWCRQELQISQSCHRCINWNVSLQDILWLRNMAKHHVRSGSKPNKRGEMLCLSFPVEATAIWNRRPSTPYEEPAKQVLRSQESYSIEENQVPERGR